MPTRASIVQADAPEFKKRPLSEQETLLDRSLGWAPLDWLTYYRRGIVRMQSHQDSDLYDADFNRALFLEQNSPELPLAIGDVCHSSDMPEAVIAWKALLQRGEGAHRENYFQDLYWSEGLDMNTRLQLATLAEGDPNMQIIAIINQNAAQFEWLRDNFLNVNPTLKDVRPDLTRKFFDYWVQVGNVQEFIDQYPAHPEWQATGWRAYANALAKVGRFQDAVTVGLQQIPAPQMPGVRSEQDLQDALRQSEINPQDFYFLIQLYFAQISTGANQTALETLEKANEIPNRPAYISYLLAKSLAAAGQYEAAWKALGPLLN
jgi:hypothetical protein